jgi:hypothetical protein
MPATWPHEADDGYVNRRFANAIHRTVSRRSIETVNSNWPESLCAGAPIAASPTLLRTRFCRYRGLIFVAPFASTQSHNRAVGTESRKTSEGCIIGYSEGRAAMLTWESVLSLVPTSHGCTLGQRARPTTCSRSEPGVLVVVLSTISSASFFGACATRFQSMCSVHSPWTSGKGGRTGSRSANLDDPEIVRRPGLPEGNAGYDDDQICWARKAFRECSGGCTFNHLLVCANVFRKNAMRAPQ